MRDRRTIGVSGAALAAFCLATTVAAQGLEPAVADVGNDAHVRSPRGTPPTSGGLILCRRRRTGRVPGRPARIPSPALCPQLDLGTTRYSSHGAGAALSSRFGVWLLPCSPLRGLLRSGRRIPIFSLGLLSDDGWIYDRYRAIWAGSCSSRSEAALWYSAATRDAATAARSRPCVPPAHEIAPTSLGYFGLGIALAGSARMTRRPRLCGRRSTAIPAGCPPRWTGSRWSATVRGWNGSCRLRPGARNGAGGRVYSWPES